MPAKTSKATDNPWAAMDALIRFSPEPMGAEWFTPTQFADRYRVGHRQALARITQMVKDGKLDYWKGTSAATRRTTNKYRVRSTT